MKQWKRLKQLREAAGLSRADLSRASGVGSTHIYRLETGRADYQKVEVGNAEALARALGVAVDDLLSDRDPIDGFLDGLRHLDHKRLSVLKDQAGKAMEDARPSAYMAFYSILPSIVSEDDVPIWFAAACIAAYCIRYDEMHGDPELPLIELPAALAQIDAENDTDMMKRRLIKVLDMAWVPDGFAAAQLYKLVRVAVQDGYRINYKTLVRDILSWNDHDQDTARCWADVYDRARTGKKGTGKKGGK